MNNLKYKTHLFNRVKQIEKEIIEIDRELIYQKFSSLPKREDWEKLIDKKFIIEEELSLLHKLLFHLSLYRYE